MKTKIILTTIVSSFILHTSAFAQGTLTPPGAPAPTMKSLAQIEPRTPIAAVPFTITQPGSYYLTTNLSGTFGQNGITISSSNVTLNLNGFTLSGVPSSLRGVYVSGTYLNLTVANGTVRGWGSTGVDGYNIGSSRNVVVEHLTVSDNGDSGIAVEAGSVVRDCLCFKNVNYGIYCAGGLVAGCVARENGTGISINSGIVSGCFVQNNAQSGILVNLAGCQITGNSCVGNNTDNSPVHAGIYVDDNNNLIENNILTANGYAGIKVNNAFYTGNVVIKNVVSGNGANNYLGAAGNDFGPIGSAATATSPWANISH